MTYPPTAPLLDCLILSVIDAEDSYGYQISQDLKDVSNMKDSALYPILKKLSDNGFVETYDKQFQGRNRRYYRITETGSKQRLYLYDEWQAYIRTVNRIISKEGRSNEQI